jgi:hypothetical protein
MGGPTEQGGWAKSLIPLGLFDFVPLGLIDFAHAQTR